MRCNRRRDRHKISQERSDMICEELTYLRVVRTTRRRKVFKDLQTSLKASEASRLLGDHVAMPLDLVVEIVQAELLIGLLRLGGRGVYLSMISICTLKPSSTSNFPSAALKVFSASAQRLRLLPMPGRPAEVLGAGGKPGPRARHYVLWSALLYTAVSSHSR